MRTTNRLTPEELAALKEERENFFLEHFLCPALGVKYIKLEESEEKGECSNADSD